MTQISNNTKSYTADHTTFGGQIYYSDFNTDYRGADNTQGSAIAIRITQDFRFDQQCRQTLENKRR